MRVFLSALLICLSSVANAVTMQNLIDGKPIDLRP